MAKYIKSRHVTGVDYVVINGDSYKRTGNYLPISTTPTVPEADITKMYVGTCSAAERGEYSLSNGGTITVPSTASEFQVKFAGSSHNDTGTVILSAGGSTCNVQLSVNLLDQLVWDTGSSGTPNNHVFTTYPSTFVYTDCNNLQYDITLAGLGSFILTGKWKSNVPTGGGGGAGNYGATPGAYGYGVAGNQPGNYVYSDYIGGSSGYNPGITGIDPTLWICPEHPPVGESQKIWLQLSHDDPNGKTFQIGTGNNLEGFIPGQSGSETFQIFLPGSNNPGAPITVDVSGHFGPQTLDTYDKNNPLVFDSPGGFIAGSTPSGNEPPPAWKAANLHGGHHFYLQDTWGSTSAMIGYWVN